MIRPCRAYTSDSDSPGHGDTSTRGYRDGELPNTSVTNPTVFNRIIEKRKRIADILVRRRPPAPGGSKFSLVFRAFIAQIRFSTFLDQLCRERRKDAVYEIQILHFTDADLVTVIRQPAKDLGCNVAGRDLPVPTSLGHICLNQRGKDLEDTQVRHRIFALISQGS